VKRVTSGTCSPTRRQGIALALLDRSVHECAEVSVHVRGREETFVVTKPPFVQADVRGRRRQPHLGLRPDFRGMCARPAWGS